MENIKYTFKDWEAGKFRLVESNSIKNPDFEIEEISIKDLPQDVSKKIQTKQKELFEKDVKFLYKLWIQAFESNLKQSRDPNYLLELEIKQTFSILNKKLPKTQNIHLQAWNMVVDRGLLCEVQNYFRRVIIQGHTHNYNYICSPDDPHCNDDQDPNSYSEALYKYYQYLRGTPIIEVEQWDNHIFRDKQCYDLFTDYWEMIPDNNFSFPNLCFIFHKMIAKEYILQHQTQKSFMKYFNEKYKTSFQQDELPKRNSKVNEAIYKKLLDKYKI